MSTESYTADHIATACRVSVRTLAVWRKAGTGPPWAKFGATVLYPVADFERWFESQIRRPQASHASSPASEATA